MPRILVLLSLSLTLVQALAGCGSGAGSLLDGGAGDGGGDGDDAGLLPGAEVVFDETQLRSFELSVAPADWQWLNDNAEIEQYVMGTLTYAGRTYGPIGVRYKGGFGTLNACIDAAGNQVCDKLSLKLKFNEYDPAGRFYGLKRLNLHSMIRDPSQMHDRISYWLHRQAGVIAPRAVHGRVLVNGELLGLYAVIEDIDGVFARDRFGADGNVYKEVWPVHTTAQPYINALETNEAAPAVDRMIRFAGDLAAATDATFRATLEAWMDVPALMRYLAVDRLIDAWDGIVGWYCFGGTCFNHNYYWYEDPLADRITLIPWDMDNSLESPSPIRNLYGMPDWHEPTSCATVTVFLGFQGRPPHCDTLIARLSTVLWDDYAAATRALLDGPARLDLLQARVDEIALQIGPAVTEDPNGPGQAAWQQAVEDLRADLPALRDRVEQQIAP